MEDVKLMGININCKKQNFIDQILNGEKTIETRSCYSLRPYVGKRVGLIETGNGRAKLKGFATIKEEVIYRTKDSFDEDFSKHRVAKESPFYFNGIKYGYVLTDVEKLNEPIEVYTNGRVAREIAY